MKKIIVISCALLGMILLVGGVGLKVWADIIVKRQQAIMSVLEQRNQAVVRAKTMPNGRKGNGFSPAVYTRGVARISTVDCPEPFSQVWLDYVQTLQRNNAPFAGLGAVTEFGVSAVKPNSDGTKDALARLDKLNTPEAWMRVQRVALRYGVQVH